MRENSFLDKSARELNREKGKIEMCRNSKSDVVVFGIA